MMKNEAILLFDIGGSKMRFAKSKDGQSFEKPLVEKTPNSYKEGLELIFGSAKKLFRKDERIKYAVGGIAGVLDKTQRTLFAAPHLGSWQGRAIYGDLENSLNTKVFLENDTALVGLGEAVYGAGKSFDICSYITISTGVNGVNIVKKKIAPSHFGFEIGHQIINFDHKEKELEELIGGANLQEKHKKLPSEIEDQSVWREVSRALSVGVYNTTLYWSPQAIVLGGAIVGKISTEEIKTNLREMLWVFPDIPQIKKAELGDFGGLWGGLFTASEYAE